MPLHGPYQPAASGEARQAVILLHGYGADGADLIGLAPYLAQALPDAAFYSPDAPFECEMSPFGRQWFSLANYDPDLMRRSPATMQPAFAAMVDGARDVAPQIAEMIDTVKTHEGLADNRSVALVGFSQGTMMALHVALRLTPPLAGVVGLSGALLGAEALQGEIGAHPPVLLIHGEDDPVVPFPAMGLAAEALAGAGVAVAAHGIPGLQHGIDETGLRLTAHFLRDCFDLS